VLVTVDVLNGLLLGAKRGLTAANNLIYGILNGMAAADR